jgi:hypothetical protein
MSIIYGFYHADQRRDPGQRQAVTIKDSQAAIATGIGMVHQHFMLVDNFTVLENIMLGAEGGALLARGVAKARAELKRLEKEYGLEVNPDALIEQLPVGLQQRVEILKAMYRGAEILILDEPTGVLTPPKPITCSASSACCATRARRSSSSPTSCARSWRSPTTVSVMRRGEMVATRKTKETTVEELAELMVGRRVLLRVAEGRGQSRQGRAVGEEPDGEGRARRGDGRQRLLRRPGRRDRRRRRRGRQRPVGAAGGDRRHPQAAFRRVLLDGQTIDKAIRPRGCASSGSPIFPKTATTWGWC